MDMIQPDQTVTLQATQKQEPHGGKVKLNLISITRQGETIHILPPNVKPDQLIETRQVVAGLEFTPKEQLQGIRLADGTQLIFPPHIGQQLAGHIQTGDMVTALGWPKPLRPGEKRADVNVPLQLYYLTTSDACLLVS